VLPVTKSEFDLASASRSNLTWYFQGKYRASLTPDELRSLTMADRAVIKPPPVKNDPFSESFGNHPIHLPSGAAPICLTPLAGSLTWSFASLSLALSAAKYHYSRRTRSLSHLRTGLQTKRSALSARRRSAMSVRNS